MKFTLLRNEQNPGDPNGHVDYSAILGQKSLFDDPLLKKLGQCKDQKEYAMFREVAESKLEEMTQGFAMLGMSAMCESRGKDGNPVVLNHHKPGHLGLQLVFACHHVIQCDDVHPSKAYFIPFKKDSKSGYFLCATCFDLMLNCKLKISDPQNGVFGKCLGCVTEAVIHRVEKDPALFVDCRLTPVGL
jgi:hypothetical protein